MYELLSKVAEDSGIWRGSRKQSHAFLLSPSVFRISEMQQKQFERLGHALYDCMLGLSHIAVVAYDPKLNYGGAWLYARRVFSTGVPSFYQDLHGRFVRDIPQLLKVDFMLSLDGSFQIVEIDGHNKHGLGYSTLGLRFRNALRPDATSLPGAVRTLAEEMHRRKIDHLKLFYADQERFYIPEFEIAQQEFRTHGIACEILGELEADLTHLEEGLFLDLPFLYKRKELYDTILSAYQRREVQFIIPPKPFLGAKGVLALIRNDAKNEHLECLLKAFIKNESLALVRAHIPETVLIGKQAESYRDAMERTVKKRYVLKESISSGMKGTVFSGDSDFQETLRRACEARMNWILQEEVVNQPQEFSWYEPSEHSPPTLMTSQDWCMRVTVQYINRKLGDIIVTARRDKAVHGAKDCLQLGTVVE